MSGTETLLPYVSEKKKTGEEPTIIVDSREASSAEKIVKGLIEKGANVKTRCWKKATTSSRTNVPWNVKQLTTSSTR